MYNIEILPVKLGGSNSYLIKCNNGYILVDTGLKGAGEKLKKKLVELESVPGDIRLIILTHSHYDHIQGLDEIKKLTGAPVAMHKDELTLFGQDSLKNNESTFLFRMIIKIFSRITPDTDVVMVKSDIFIPDEMNLIEYGLNANIIHTPGHTPGSVCILTDDCQCIAGDTLFDMFPGTHYPIIVYDKIKLADTYKKLDKLNPDVFYPGHGKAITRKMFKDRIMNRKKYFNTGG